MLIGWLAMLLLGVTVIEILSVNLGQNGSFIECSRLASSVDQFDVDRWIISSDFSKGSLNLAICFSCNVSSVNETI